MKRYMPSKGATKAAESLSYPLPWLSDSLESRTGVYSSASALLTPEVVPEKATRGTDGLKPGQEQAAGEEKKTLDIVLHWDN